MESGDNFFNWFSENETNASHEASLASSPAIVPNNQTMSLSPVNTSLIHSMSALQTTSNPSTPGFPNWANPFDLSTDGHRLASHILHYHDPDNTQDHRRPCIADNPSMVFANCSLPRLGDNSQTPDATDFFADLTYDCGFEVEDPLAFARHVFQEHRPALMIQDPYVAGFANESFQNQLSGFIPSMPPLPGPAYDFRGLPETGRCHSLPASTATNFSFQHSFPGTPIRAPTPSATDCDCIEAHCPPEVLAKELDRELLNTSTESGAFSCSWNCEHDGQPCEKSFPTTAALHEHCKDCHTKSATKEDGQYWCKWEGCERQEGFTQRAKLERHLQTHSGCQ